MPFQMGLAVFNKSIRTTLMLPSVLVVFFTGLVVSLFSFQNATSSIRSVSDQLRQEKLERVIDHLEVFFSVPQKVLQENARLLAEDTLNRKDPSALERHFLKQNIEFGFFNSIYYGNTDGGLVVGGVEAQDGSYYVISTQDFRSGHFRKFKADATGTRQDMVLSLPSFDARTRPWYTAGKDAENGAWSDIYILFTGHDMAITPSRAVRSPTGELLGVVGGDIFLSGISRYLRKLHDRQPGQTFVMDKDGYLVASSTDERPFSISDDGKVKTRILAANSSIGLISASAQAIKQTFANIQTLDGPESLEVVVGDEKSFVEFASFADRHGLSLIVATIVPERVYTRALKEGNDKTLVLIVAALLIMAAITVLLAERIIKPISVLTSCTKEMAEGHVPTQLETNRQDEIGALSRSFNDMAQKLNMSFEQLKARERQLSNQGRFLDSIIDNIPNMIFVKDAEELKFVRFNKTGEDLLGVSSEELIGKNDFDFFPDEQAEFFISKDREVLSSKQLLDVPQEPIDTQKRGKRILHTRKVGVYDESGQALYLLGISEDVTDRIAAEEQLKAAKEEAEKANKAKTELLSIVSHELRTPLTSIKGALGLLTGHFLKDLSGDPKILMKTALTNTDRLVLLVDDILDMEKLISGNVALQMEDISLRQLVSQTIEQNHGYTHKDEVQFDLISGSEDAVVRGDYFKLGQVLGNFLSNAAKFSRAGDKVEIAISTCGDMARVSVTDYGCGIPEDFQDKVFEKFAQAAQAQRQSNQLHKGTGLGLSIAKGIIDQHGGRIGFNSTPGAGSVFYFELKVRGESV